jgi:hypothetical protein
MFKFRDQIPGDIQTINTAEDKYGRITHAVTYADTATGDVHSGIWREHEVLDVQLYAHDSYIRENTSIITELERVA